MFFEYVFKEKKSGVVTLFFPFLILTVFLLAVTPILLSCAKSVSVEKEKSGRVFILDAGHGGEDCGAIGKNGAYEKDLNCAITMELGRQLSDLGYTVVYTRTEDKLLYTDEENIKGLRKIYDLKNRVRIAESYPDATFVSLHMNSFSDPRYDGLQVFYSGNHEESYILAASVQSQVKEKLQPNNNRSIREGAGLYLMENLTCPAVLIECGFISNSSECEKLCEKEYQKQLCFAILCGIIDVNTKKK